MQRAFSDVCESADFAGSIATLPLNGLPVFDTSLAVGSGDEIMTDVLGEALKKLYSKELPQPASVSSDTECGVGETTASSEPVNTVVSIDAIERTMPPTVYAAVEQAMVEMATVEPAPAEHTAAIQPELAAADQTQPEKSFIEADATIRSTAPVTWKTPIPFVLLHRRQAAAAVVLICMFAMWSGEESSTNTPSTPESDLADVESLLSDFTSADGVPLREPAEPVDPQFPSELELTIPQPMTEQSEQFAGRPVSPTSTADAVYPDEVPLNSSTGIGLSFQNPTGQTTSGQKSALGNRNGVRFTGNIQPLK